MLRRSVYDRAAKPGWTDYTPTLAQNGTVAATVNYAKFRQIGDFVAVSVRLDATGTGTSGNTITVSLPVTAADTLGLSGSGRYFDSSSSTQYVVSVLGASTTAVRFTNDASGANLLGVVPAFAVGSGDDIQFSLFYEAA